MELIADPDTKAPVVRFNFPPPLSFPQPFPSPLSFRSSTDACVSVFVLEGARGFFMHTQRISNPSLASAPRPPTLALALALPPSLADG